MNDHPLVVVNAGELMDFVRGLSDRLTLTGNDVDGTFETTREEEGIHLTKLGPRPS
jgi:hypothetical protein